MWILDWQTQTRPIFDDQGAFVDRFAFGAQVRTNTAS
jgi:hypothetical protein